MGLNLPTLALAKKYTDLKTSVTDKQINAAVNQYLENNPVSPGASPEESAQIGANKQNITNLQNEIVMRSPAIITEAIGTGKVRMDDSSSNPFIGMGIKGRSGQVVTTGAQLLDLSAVSKSAGGAVVNYGDGGYTISGTGTLTVAFSASYQLDYLKNQLKPGNLILKSELTIPKMYIRIWDGNTVLAEMQGNSTKQITQEMLDNDNIRIECFLYGTAGSTITPGTYHPMLYQSGDGTWEPYTGGKPSPSPEYPQEIVGTGMVSTGAQLFDTSKLVRTHNEVKFTVEENGGILVTGNTLQNAANSAVVPVTLSPGTYYMSGSTPIGNSQIFVRIKLWHGDSSTVISDASFSVDGTETKIECFIQLYQGLSDFKAVVYPMLNAGSTPKPWEPYTGGKPSPSPEYPQTMDVMVTGAQLLDLGIVEDINAGGATVSIFDGGYTISGTGALTASIEKRYRTDIKKLLKPGNLTLKSTISIPRIYITVRNKSTQLLSLYGNNTGQITQEMLDDENIYIEVMFFGSKDTIITPGTYYSMLYQDGDGTWQPYQSRTATITLTEPLRGIDDHNDMITMTKRIDRCVEMTFDGRENWAAISTYEGFYYAGILPFSAMRRAGLCNQFPVDTKGDAIESVRIGNGNSVLFCVHSRFYDDAASDKGLSAWKAHLASHPLKVVTYLDTPVETDLDADTIAALAELTTYKGHTTVSVAAGGPEPDITMEYIADTKTYIANEHAKMQAEFDKQIAAILALLPAETQAAMINNETSALLAESEV